MKKTHVTLVLLFLCLGISLFAKNSSAKSKEQPYELSVQILQNADNIAEVTIDITVIKDGYSAPTTAKQIKLKSSSLEKIFKNVELTPKTDGSGSSVVLQYENTKNAESIKVTVKIKEKKGNIKLNATGEVLLLPDVTVSDIALSNSITEKQETTINAKISELNGDTEAAADVSLLVGDTVISNSPVTLQPGETRDVSFTTTFDTAGTYNVTVRIDNVQPEDYDQTNNSSSTTVMVSTMPPDLNVSELNVKCFITEKQEANITAKISELNGGAGASADVFLLIEDTIVGSATVTVKAGETTDVSFTTTFDAAGTYNATVRIDNVQPQDYDQTNNSQATTVSVSASPVESLALSENLNYVFDINALPVITITISTDEWNNQLLYYDSNPKHEEYSTADFEFEKNGEIENMEGIGFRIRGGTYSRIRLEGEAGELHDPESPDWHRAHLKIDFNEYDKDARFKGLRGLNLRSFSGDDSYVREVYCYDLFKKFGVWTAPLSSYARVYIKVKEDDAPAYYGVYCMVENIDKEFIQERFGKDNDEGYLWKCRNPGDLNYANLNTDKIGVEDISLNEEESYRPYYDLKTNKSDLETAKEQLIQFIEDLNSKEGDEFVDWIQSEMDVDHFLRFLAVNVLIGSWDDHWLNANNYYLYFDESEKLYFIPYDYDRTLGISYLLENTGTQDVMKWGTMNNSRPLVYKILSVQQFRDQYKAYLQELIDENNDYFDYDHSVCRINEWQEMIAAYIENDTYEMMEIIDQPPDWSNATFYRLLSGDDSGAEPEANWFMTRSSFAMEQITADADWTPGVAPITAELYLMGSMNDWEAGAEYKFTNTDGLYTLEVGLSSGDYTFRIADASTNEHTNFGASYYRKSLTNGKKHYLYSEYSDPILADIEWSPEEAGMYRFEFDATDSENPTLLVTLVE
ncbi:CotH kinase family protein [Candidatus Kuenenia sp.]|uniref:CotH kinase family protein n=1 Tax=Candidatus Kuenenia sp. TaxID=2499824 RepID=UPI00321FB8B8